MPVVPDADLNISLGIGEGKSLMTIDGNLFPPYEMAFYPPGLWGDGEKKHLPIGWFDEDPSGYYVSLNDANSTMIDQLTSLMVIMFHFLVIGNLIDG